MIYDEDIEKYTEEIDFSQFENSGLLQDAVIRRIELIGEAAKRLSVDSSIRWCWFEDSLEYD